MFYRVGKNSTPSGVTTTTSPLRVTTCWNEFKCLPSNLRAGVDLWTQYTLSHLNIGNFRIYNKFLIMMMMIIIIIIAELYAREARLSIQENLVMTSAYDLPSVQTLGEGGRESEVNPSGKEYVIAEVKFCISSTSFVSEVNHMTVRTFREKKKRVFLSTKF